MFTLVFYGSLVGKTNSGSTTIFRVVSPFLYCLHGISICIKFLIWNAVLGVSRRNILIRVNTDWTRLEKPSQVKYPSRFSAVCQYLSLCWGWTAPEVSKEEGSYTSRFESYEERVVFYFSLLYPVYVTLFAQLLAWRSLL